jgi:ABC-type transporter Mla MlaB component
MSGVLRIEGELTYANANARWTALVREFASAAESATEIDLSGVTRLDSAGLALLTALRAYRGEPSNGAPGGSAIARRLIHATPEVRRLATAYDVAELFN